MCFNGRSFNLLCWFMFWIQISLIEFMTWKFKVEPTSWLICSKPLTTNNSTFRLRTLESENLRMSTMINTTNRQVDIRLNEIEQRLVDGDSSQEEFSLEEEEKNQESFIWASTVRLGLANLHVTITIMCSRFLLWCFNNYPP